MDLNTIMYGGLTGTQIMFFFLEYAWQEQERSYISSIVMLIISDRSVLLLESNLATNHLDT
jgi:hypothetical protein